MLTDLIGRPADAFVAEFLKEDVLRTAQTEGIEIFSAER